MSAAKLSWTLAGVAVRQRICKMSKHKWGPWFTVHEDDGTKTTNRICSRCVDFESYGLPLTMEDKMLLAIDRDPNEPYTGT